ncbi:hypothetical protein AVEN_52922-1 [Araneus ventricosus]|uniref:Uncharacterized protein n=1 Tax=Araneus ventricosus TaxID=182803 RepID=A0A4Y2FFY9_ARAVE|nr:hypothetical protein AVEN_52922-1 [Araneus ventricosus]
MVAESSSEGYLRCVYHSYLVVLTRDDFPLKLSTMDVFDELGKSAVPLLARLIILTSHLKQHEGYILDGPRNFEPCSDDDDETSDGTLFKIPHHTC